MAALANLMLLVDVLLITLRWCFLHRCVGEQIMTLLVLSTWKYMAIWWVPQTKKIVNNKLTFLERTLNPKLVKFKNTFDIILCSNPIEIPDYSLNIFKLESTQIMGLGRI